MNSFGNDRYDLALHPTVKPVALVADAIRDCSHRKGIVLDAFAGSGTTLIAAEQTGGYGIEIDPLYCDVIIRRLRTLCRLEAILESAGKSFSKSRSNALNRADLRNWRARLPIIAVNAFVRPATEGAFISLQMYRIRTEIWPRHDCDRKFRPQTNLFVPRG